MFLGCPILVWYNIPDLGTCSWVVLSLFDITFLSWGYVPGLSYPCSIYHSCLGDMLLGCPILVRYNIPVLGICSWVVLSLFDIHSCLGDMFLGCPILVRYNIPVLGICSWVVLSLFDITFLSWGHAPGLFYPCSIYIPVLGTCSWVVLSLFDITFLSWGYAPGLFYPCSIYHFCLGDMFLGCSILVRYIIPVLGICSWVVLSLFDISFLSWGYVPGLSYPCSIYHSCLGDMFLGCSILVWFNYSNTLWERKIWRY